LEEESFTTGATLDGDGTWHRPENTPTADGIIYTPDSTEESLDIDTEASKLTEPSSEEDPKNGNTYLSIEEEEDSTSRDSVAGITTEDSGTLRSEDT